MGSCKHYNLLKQISAWLVIVLLFVSTSSACNPTAIPATSPLPTIPATYTPRPTLTLTITRTPLPTESQAIAEVAVTSLNLRTGPGTEFAVVNSLIGVEILIVLGRNQDGTWLKVQTTDPLNGWVSTDLVRLDVPIADIPITP